MNQNNECYLQYLPPVLWRENRIPNNFTLGRFLSIFQEILHDLETRIDGIPDIFDPYRTAKQFVPWLASWVALELDKEEWMLEKGTECSEQKARIMIRSIVTLYRMRGTLLGLQKYLITYFPNCLEVKIEEPNIEEIINGTKSPYTFQITMRFPTSEEPDLARIAQQVLTIVEREKPAHTYYNLLINNNIYQ
jgi:phage tail-like protein